VRGIYAQKNSSRRAEKMTQSYWSEPEDYINPPNIDMPDDIEDNWNDDLDDDWNVEDDGD